MATQRECGRQSDPGRSSDSGKLMRAAELNNGFCIWCGDEAECCGNETFRNYKCRKLRDWVSEPEELMLMQEIGLLRGREKMTRHIAALNAFPNKFGTFTGAIRNEATGEGLSASDSPPTTRPRTSFASRLGRCSARSTTHQCPARASTSRTSGPIK